MRKIGEGYWYNVFELSGNKVTKIEKRYVEKVAHLLRLKKQPSAVMKAAIRFITEKPNIKKVYSHINTHVDPSLVAHPVFLSGIDYEQDKVIELEKIFKSTTSNRQKELIDCYIDHVLRCVKYGFFDCKFNFLENNGLHNLNIIVLHDFNEVTLDKQQARQLIKIKRWRNAYSARCLTEEIRGYLFQQMMRRVTIREIETTWGSLL